MKKRSLNRIAVTGGLGFIGTNLIPNLIDEFDAEIRILDNLSNPSNELNIVNNIQLIEGDITDSNSVNQLINGVDAVIHLAAHTRVIDSIADPYLNYTVNVQGTFNILESMRRHNVVNLVNASTGGAILGEVEPPINENIPAKPASPYGASKLACEGYCWAYAQSYGFNAVSLRFSNIYGPNSLYKESVVAAFMKAIHNDKSITIYGDGTQTRDYLYIDDLTDGIIKAIKSNAIGVYQLGSGIGTSVNSLINVIRDVTNIDFEVIHKPARVGEILNTYCDITKARTELGFSPKTILLDGITKTWTWYLDKFKQ